jgi:hypothetical protein
MSKITEYMEVVLAICGICPANNLKQSQAKANALFQ